MNMMRELSDADIAAVAGGHPNDAIAAAAEAAASQLSAPEGYSWNVQYTYDDNWNITSADAVLEKDPILA